MQVTRFISALGVYHFQLEPLFSSNNYACISVGKLENFYPLSVYLLNSKKVVALKHYVSSLENDRC